MVPGIEARKGSLNARWFLGLTRWIRPFFRALEKIHRGESGTGPQRLGGLCHGEFTWCDLPNVLLVHAYIYNVPLGNIKCSG